MKGEGHWLNWRTGKAVAVREHERDIRNPAVAKRLGVPPEVFKRFRRFVPEQDRCRFLRWLLKRVPLMRIRDHGTHVTFEYNSQGDKKPLAAAVMLWAGRASPATLLKLVNLRSQRHWNVLAHLFLKEGVR